MKHLAFLFLLAASSMAAAQPQRALTLGTGLTVAPFEQERQLYAAFSLGGHADWRHLLVFGDYNLAINDLGPIGRDYDGNAQRADVFWTVGFDANYRFDWTEAVAAFVGPGLMLGDLTRTYASLGIMWRRSPQWGLALKGELGWRGFGAEAWDYFQLGLITSIRL